MLERVIAYVDGFNLYYGLKTKGYKRYYWLNIRKLVGKLLRPNQSLESVKYFTARISHNPANPSKHKRQATYLDALGTLPAFSLVYGHYLANLVTCRGCGATYDLPSEKMTDVNIATAMLMDAFGDRFDCAMLISGDSDLSPVVRSIQSFFVPKRVVVAFPPCRRSAELARAAAANFMIGRGKLSASQFSPIVLTRTGFQLRRPAEWR